MGLPRIVIVGGGFAALQAAFALRRALGEKARLVLVSDRLQFVYRPNTIYVPFGVSPATLLLQLTEPARRKGIELRIERATGLRMREGRLVTEAGEVPYDYLLLASGSRTDAEAVPGLAEHGRSIVARDGMLRLYGDFEAVAEAAARGRRRRVVFLAAQGSGWTGPLYEVALLLEDWLRQRALRATVDLHVVTHEQACLEGLGEGTANILANELSRREVALRTGARTKQATREGVELVGEGMLEADLLVAAPPQRGATDGLDELPREERGFVCVSSESRAVQGHERIYAIGDCSDFPLKLGYLALLQGEAAASHVAHEVAPQQPFEPFEPVALCMLDMGGTAVFVRRSLLRGAAGVERVSETPLWKAAKKMLGMYLPRQFRHGEPFHEGLSWDLMERMMDAMVRLLKGARPS